MPTRVITPYYDIIPMKVPCQAAIASLPASMDGSGLLAKVTPASPLRIRQATERLAYFAKRELRCNFAGYEATEQIYDSHIYLWSPGCHTMDDHGRIPVTGFAIFRQRNYSVLGPCLALVWVWIHPFLRRQGILTRAWPFFKQEHGEFLVEPPYSQAMQGFLKTHTNYLEWLESAEAEAQAEVR